LKLQTAAGFEKQFNEAFDGFIKDELPKNIDAVKIEAANEAKKKIEAAKTNKTLNILGQPSVLP